MEENKKILLIINLIGLIPRCLWPDFEVRLV